MSIGAIREKIQRETRLLFGARIRKDLYYLNELRDLECKIKNFTFTATLSRPEEGDRWEGERGCVTDLIKKYIPGKASIDAYLCGSPGMVESSMELLLKKGIPRDRIFFDKFKQKMFSVSGKIRPSGGGRIFEARQE